MVIDHDKPWEGGTCAYHTVFQDGDLYRMYYRGSGAGNPYGTVVCYAESKDGIHCSPLRHIEPGEERVHRRGTITTDGNCPGWSANSCRMAGHHAVITDGEFDSLNVGFWDPVRRQYVAFYRDAGGGETASAVGSTELSAGLCGGQFGQRP